MAEDKADRPAMAADEAGRSDKVAAKDEAGQPEVVAAEDETGQLEIVPLEAEANQTAVVTLKAEAGQTAVVAAEDAVGRRRRPSGRRCGPIRRQQPRTSWRRCPGPRQPNTGSRAATKILVVTIINIVLLLMLLHTITTAFTVVLMSYACAHAITIGVRESSHFPPPRA